MLEQLGNDQDGWSGRRKSIASRCIGELGLVSSVIDLNHQNHQHVCYHFPSPVPFGSKGRNRAITTAAFVQAPTGIWISQWIFLSAGQNNFLIVKYHLILLALLLLGCCYCFVFTLNRDVFSNWRSPGKVKVLLPSTIGIQHHCAKCTSDLAGQVWPHVQGSVLHGDARVPFRR